jgi:hypothetical protein
MNLEEVWSRRRQQLVKTREIESDVKTLVLRNANLEADNKRLTQENAQLRALLEQRITDGHSKLALALEDFRQLRYEATRGG